MGYIQKRQKDISVSNISGEFIPGVNYGWLVFGGDFGGIRQWNQAGVSENRQAYENDFRIMRESGVKLVRWWVWPELRTESIVFSGDRAVRIEQRALQDLDAALEIAANNDIKIMLTLLSFDGSRPSRNDSGLFIRGYKNVFFGADTNRSGFLQNIIRPFAQRVANSRYRSQVHSWDMINEPEFAMKGDNKYASLIQTEWTSGYGETFDLKPEMEQVTHDQMESLLIQVKDILKATTPEIPVTVGSAAVKWATSAWTGVRPDFHSPHIYDWVNNEAPWAYDLSPEELGFMDCKPVMIGEYPIDGLSANRRHGMITPQNLINTFRDVGYVGALAWDFTLEKRNGEASLRQKLAHLTGSAIIEPDCNER